MSKISQAFVMDELEGREVQNPRTNKQRNYTQDLYTQAKRIKQRNIDPAKRANKVQQKTLDIMRQNAFKQRNDDSLYNPAM